MISRRAARNYRCQQVHTSQAGYQQYLQDCRGCVHQADAKAALEKQGHTPSRTEKQP